MRNLTELDKYRDHIVERRYFKGANPHPDLSGWFLIPTKGVRKGIKVVVSSGELSPHGWDHVSASLPFRTPDWGEMCKLKDLFFFPHEVAFQLHPAEGNNISTHNFCLHLWRNIHQDIPLPPPEMVGLKGMDNLKGITLEQIHAIQDKASARM